MLLFFADKTDKAKRKQKEMKNNNTDSLKELGFIPYF